MRYTLLGKKYLIAGCLLIWASLCSAQPEKAAPWVGHDLFGLPCVGGSGYGPYDYTNPNHRGHNLSIVEGAHFTKEVESLVKGNRGSLIQDLDYTLRAFPNHHRALYAMMRYQKKVKRPAGASYPAVECYFQRAILFSPNDHRVMQLYANYLIKKKQFDMAESIYKKALNVPRAPATINYSLGLLYFDMKKFDDAVEQAKIAYGAGIKKSKLARKLKSVNRWPAP